MSCYSLAAQEPFDTNAVFQIDSSAIVTAQMSTSGLKGDITKGLDVEMKTILSFPKMLGTSDPLKFVQALPGVTTNSDWECGLRGQGCEASQSVTKLCDVPVYGQGHILGLFSVFNPGHFKNMKFSTSSQMRRIGGELDMETADSLSTGVHGEGNLGPVSTHACISFPMGKKSSMTVSGRRSFVDLFYKGLIKMEGADMNYYFYDINASLLHKIDSFNSIDANAYFGKDNGWMDSDKSNSFIGANWGNAVGNLRWKHNKNGLKMSTQLYGSTFFMTGGLGIVQNSGRAEDSILDLGLSSKADWNNWQFSLETNYYNIRPQSIYDDSSASQSESIMPRQHAILGTLRASKRLEAGRWVFTPGLAASIYGEVTSKKVYPRADPELKLEYNMYKKGKLSIDAGYKHQYLFMTGMTNSGFPVEFWIGAGQYSDPQSSLYGTLSYSVNIADEAFSLSLQAYGKRLWNLIEYSGFLTEMMGGNYDLEKMLLKGTGYNYGASVQLQKNSGRLTGWIAYNWGRSLREFPDSEHKGTYPSSHERIHELNAVASYKIGRWDFGGNFIFASGVPYTPVTAVFILNEDILVKYGELNSRRLAPYVRLDLSASFNIRTKGRFRDGINISVQNATARKNELMATLKVKDGKYQYAPAKLVIPVIPSVNYFCNF